VGDLVAIADERLAEKEIRCHAHLRIGTGTLWYGTATMKATPGRVKQSKSRLGMNIAAQEGCGKDG